LTHAAGVRSAVGFYSGLPQEGGGHGAGNRITDLQVTKYKELRGRHTQEAAAAKTGISVSSARRIWPPPMEQGPLCMDLGHDGDDD
jgi:hypothetical protein